MAGKPLQIIIKDNSNKQTLVNKKNAGQATKVLLSLSKSFDWYNVSVTYDGYTAFEKRFAGRAETGKDSKTDPLMGRILQVSDCRQLEELLHYTVY